MSHWRAALLTLMLSAVAVAGVFGYRHLESTFRLAFGGAPKGQHDGLGGGAVVRTGSDVLEREVSIPIEDEVTAHLRQVELFRMPDPSPQDQADVTPDRAWGCDCH